MFYNHILFLNFPTNKKFIFGGEIYCINITNNNNTRYNNSTVFSICSHSWNTSLLHYLYSSSPDLALLWFSLGAGFWLDTSMFWPTDSTSSAPAPARHYQVIASTSLAMGGCLVFLYCTLHPGACLRIFIEAWIL